MSFHTIKIGNVSRNLPIREVAPGVRVALFNVLGDWELTEIAGEELAKLIDPSVEVLVMPDGKAVALMHVVGRESGRPTIIARKEQKPYMANPVVHVTLKSITTNKVQTLFLGNDDAEFLRNRVVAIVDDVVSSGGTLVATKQLMAKVDARVVQTLAIFTEGDERPDVTTLGHLPLF